MRKISEKDDIYLAIPSAITHTENMSFHQGLTNDYYSTETSNPLGFFLVKPVKEIKIYREFGEIIPGILTTGYREIITKKKIIKNTFKNNGLGGIDGYRHDVEADIKPKIGDVFWQVTELTSVINLVGVEKIEEYLHTPKKELKEKLKNLHNLARVVALQSIEEQRKEKEEKGKVLIKKQEAK